MTYIKEKVLFFKGIMLLLDFGPFFLSHRRIWNQEMHIKGHFGHTVLHLL